jgi:multiple antibiotic resistance protein
MRRDLTRAPARRRAFPLPAHGVTLSARPPAARAEVADCEKGREVLNDAINYFTTLFVVIDPVGNVPIFLALTVGMSSAQRLSVAVRGVLIGAGILMLFGLAGDAILRFVGISMPAFKIAGGILLFATALDMLFEKRTERRERQAEDSADDPSVFPLATPLIAGPGSIATMILLMDDKSGNLEGQATVALALVGVLSVTLAFLLLAGPLERLLRRTGTMVVTRLLGMLLAALSVQFVIDGLAASGLVPGG